MAFGEYANFFGDWTETAQKAQKTAYDYNQTRGLGAALRDSMNPDGTPNERKYYELINKYKIDQDPASEYFKRMAGIYSSGASTATSATQMEGLGADPSKLVGDPNASAGEMFGVKKKAVEPVGTTDVSSTSVPEPSKPSELDSRVSTTSGYTTTEPTPGQPTLIRPNVESPVMLPPPVGDYATPEQRSAAKTGMPVDMSEIPVGTERNLGASALSGAVQPPAQPQDEMFVTNFLRNIKSPVGQGMGGAGGAGMGEPDASLFSWTPTNVDGNVYQQYADSADKLVKANGFTDTSDYLRKTYDAVLKENTPTSPNELQLVLGKEGMAKYGDQRQAYIAAMGIAKGKAEKAVIEARNGLSKFAQENGKATVDQRTTELPNGVLLRDPSKRAEANALLINQNNIAEAEKSLTKAGTNMIDLELTAPEVIRAYVTPQNPGMQISDGNIRETAMRLYPEFGSNHDMTMKLMGAIALSLKGDSSALKGMLKKIDALAPGTLAERLRRMLDEAKVNNDKGLDIYTIRPPKKSPEKREGDDKKTGGDGAGAGTTAPPGLSTKDKETVASKAILGPAKTSSKTAPARKPGESYVDYLRRTRK